MATTKPLNFTLFSSDISIRNGVYKMSEQNKNIQNAIDKLKETIDALNKLHNVDHEETIKGLQSQIERLENLLE